jgi:hypothetical protein
MPPSPWCNPRTVSYTPHSKVGLETSSRTGLPRTHLQAWEKRKARSMGAALQRVKRCAARPKYHLGKPAFSAYASAQAGTLGRPQRAVELLLLIKLQAFAPAPSHPAVGWILPEPTSHPACLSGRHSALKACKNYVPAAHMLLASNPTGTASAPKSTAVQVHQRHCTQSSGGGGTGRLACTGP